MRDSRENEFGTRRRRECAVCEHRWTTQEISLDEEKLNPHTFDPWAEYRKAAVMEWLTKQLRSFQ